MPVTLKWLSLHCFNADEVRYDKREKHEKIQCYRSFWTGGLSLLGIEAASLDEVFLSSKL